MRKCHVLYICILGSVARFRDGLFQKPQGANENPRGQELDLGSY
jgi:hypothetical protein